MAEERCRNCGSELPEGAQYCTTCGAPAPGAWSQGAGEAPPSGQQPGYVPPPPSGQQPGYAPPPYAPPGYGQPPYGAYPAVHYAGFWRRFAAIIIDGIILAIALTVIRYVFLGAALRMSGGALTAVYDLIGLAAGWLYWSLMESSSMQATVGKMALGIVVTDLYGRRISFARATGRYFAKYISGLIFCIGYLMAGFTSKKQALHDMIASTLVVVQSPYR